MNAPSTSSLSARGRWMALAAALLGWMFDGFEMGLFSMVGRSAVTDLLGPNPDDPAKVHPQVGPMFSVILALFLVGAATGGVLFGWLGDRIGRVRAMSLSILTYALFTGLCGFAPDVWSLAALRFIAALGMGGEWSLGVALVMEVWPNRSRALMAGLIGAAANVGFMLVGILGLMLLPLLASIREFLAAAGVPGEMAASLVKNQGWRIMMLSGALPALLTFFIRLFVPESEQWKREQGKGTTSHWQTADLLGVLVGSLGAALIVFVWTGGWAASLDAAGRSDAVLPLRLAGSLLGLLVCTGGYLYPAYRFLQRQSGGTGSAETGFILKRMLLGALLSGIPLMATWGSAQWAPTWAAELPNGFQLSKTLDSDSPTPREIAAKIAPAQGAKEWMQIVAGLGACVGTIGAALLGDRLGRKPTYLLMCVVGAASLLYFYQSNTAFNTHLLASGFMVGVCTASFYGWLPLYLPELFPTKVRATGQGFCFNFGRIIAAIGTLQTGLLTNMFEKPVTWMGLVFNPGWQGACSVMVVIYAAGVVAIAFAPETRGRPLPE